MDEPCKQCQSTDYLRLETIVVSDESGNFLQAESRGRFKCANCGVVVEISEEGPMMVSGIGTRHAASYGLPTGPTNPRVRGIVESKADNGEGVQATDRRRPGDR